MIYFFLFYSSVYDMCVYFKNEINFKKGRKNKISHTHHVPYYITTKDFIPTSLSLLSVYEKKLSLDKFVKTSFEATLPSSTCVPVPIWQSLTLHFDSIFTFEHKILFLI